MNTSLIVGGSKGIGLEIANTFRKRGDKVYVLSRNKNNWDGDFIQADLSDMSSLEDALNFLRKNKIKIDYLVFSQKNRIDPKSLDMEMQISLKATQFLIKDCIPDILSTGSVVFLGSPIGYFVMQDASVEYHICKAAFEQLARYYAVQYGKYGIRFNTVLPSTTVLKEANRAFFDEHPKITDMLKKISPLKKISESQDVANAVGFFCSDQSTFITGQTLAVDGGQSLVAHEGVARQLVEIS